MCLNCIFQFPKRLYNESPVRDTVVTNDRFVKSSLCVMQFKFITIVPNQITDGVLEHFVSMVISLHAQIASIQVCCYNPIKFNRYHSYSYCYIRNCCCCFFFTETVRRVAEEKV